MSYSIALRTLGDSTYLETELREIYAQTLKPEKVLIFIPQGFERPKFQIADEQYTYVKKGMMNQRILPYDEITSEYILMLDDDVALKHDSIEKLINIANNYKTDLLGVDTFHNHKLSLAGKIKAIISNLVFPHFSQKWAFKILSNGSFSYIINPKKNYYPSQSCAGNAMLWKTSAYRKLHLEDELWLDSLPFAYGDDMIESYKVYKNGLKLGVVFNSGIRHLDLKSASASYHTNPEKIKIRTIAQLAVWWRTYYNPGNTNLWKKSLAAISFSLKMIWQFVMFLSLSLVKYKFSYIVNFIKGATEGWKFVHSEPFRSLPPYVVK